MEEVASEVAFLEATSTGGNRGGRRNFHRNFTQYSNRGQFSGSNFTPNRGRYVFFLKPILLKEPDMKITLLPKH